MHGVFLRLVLAVLLLVAAVAHAHHAAPQAVLRDANASGVIATVSTGGVIDPANPFFQSVGRNGRACVSCHDPAEGWTITPAGARARFETSEGLDPLFRTNDGSVSPDRKSTRLNSSHQIISYAVFCLKKKKQERHH